jgi:hypothetical protein
MFFHCSGVRPAPRGWAKAKVAASIDRSKVWRVPRAAALWCGFPRTPAGFSKASQVGKVPNAILDDRRLSSGGERGRMTTTTRALDQLRQLGRELDHSSPGAAGSLGEGMEERVTLTGSASAATSSGRSRARTRSNR